MEQQRKDGKRRTASEEEEGSVESFNPSPPVLNPGPPAHTYVPNLAANDEKPDTELLFHAGAVTFVSTNAIQFNREESIMGGQAHIRRRERSMAVRTPLMFSGLICYTLLSIATTPRSHRWARGRVRAYAAG